MFRKFAAPRRAPAPRAQYIKFEGGLDMETPEIFVKPGVARDCSNYEAAATGGYRDIVGYERYDGRPRPSDAAIAYYNVTITGAINVNDTLTGATSGTTAVVVAVGLFDPNNTGQYRVAVTRASGLFTNGESVKVGGVVQATITQSPTLTVASYQAQHLNLAADSYRASIAVVPGQGAVWGGFTLGAHQYAIRNKVGGATAAIYVDGGSGWTEVPLGRELAFTSGGTYVTKVGDTITGATSAATAVITRVQVTSGTFAGGDAAGYLTFASQTGVFVAENLNVGGNPNVATIAANSVAITLIPNSNSALPFSFDVSNFADGTHDRVYGADGANTGWEFDGTIFAFVRTGMATDRPNYVKVHKNQLFYSFGASVQHSGIGDPMSWTVVSGAAEIRTIANVTGFQIQPGSYNSGALVIACKSQMYVLYGNSVADWNLVAYRQSLGAVPMSMQSMAQTLFLSDMGLTALQTTQAFGNFSHSTLSANIRRRLSQFIAGLQGTYPAVSYLVRSKDQYRVFFGLEGFHATILDNQLVGMMPIELAVAPVCVWTCDIDANGERFFMGGSDGYVYELERGTSFDGANISAFLELHVDHAKSPEIWKSYFAPVTIESRGQQADQAVEVDTDYAAISLTYYLDYQRSGVSQAAAQTVALSVAHDIVELATDSPGEPTTGIDLRGEGRNIRWVISKNSDYMPPRLLSGIHYYYLPRARQRA